MSPKFRLMCSVAAVVSVAVGYVLERHNDTRWVFLFLAAFIVPEFISDARAMLTTSEEKP